MRQDVFGFLLSDICEIQKNGSFAALTTEYKELNGFCSRNLGVNLLNFCQYMISGCERDAVKLLNYLQELKNG